MAEGWGPGTREQQHASRDTISERWGERTHSKTQAQPRLHPSALAAGRLLLSTLGSRVENTSLTFHISCCCRVTGSSIEQARCRCCCLARYSFVMATALSCVCMRACELCSNVLHLPVHVQSGSAANRVRQRSQRDVQGVPEEPRCGRSRLRQLAHENIFFNL